MVDPNTSAVELTKNFARRERADELDADAPVEAERLDDRLERVAPRPAKLWASCCARGASAGAFG